jgi:phenylalanyl-tRNA synthetase alpha chain
MLEKQISELQAAALARIGAARSPEDLESVRVDVLGRKGALAQISKEMGKLAPEERARAGKLLNQVKNDLESLILAAQNRFSAQTMAARLDAEWIDVTLPAPGTRPGSLASWCWTGPRSKPNITTLTL